MITRIVNNKKVYDLKGSAVTETINASGYKSAKIVSKVTALSSGYQTVTFTNEREETIKLYGNYIANNLLFNQYQTESGANNGEWYINLDGVDELTITKTANNYVTGNLYIYFSYDEFKSGNSYPDGCIVRAAGSAQSYEFDVTNNYVKVDCKFATVPTNTYTVKFYGLADGAEEYTLLSPWSFTKGTRYSAGYYQGKENFDFWVYAVGYTKIKIEVAAAYQQHTPMYIYVYQSETLTRKICIKTHSINIPNSSYLLGKVKYAIIDFNDTSLTERHGFFGISSDSDYAPEVYNHCGERLMINTKCEFGRYKNNFLQFKIAGETISGKFILKWNKPVGFVNAVIAPSNTQTLKQSPSTTVYNGNLIVTLSDADDILFDEKELPIKKTNNYSVYQHDINGEIVDALCEDVLVKISNTSYKLYRCGLEGWNYNITIDSTHIPSLLEGEEVLFAKLVKDNTGYIGSEPTVVCLFTNKNRILRNFVNGFYDYFVEAPVYNLKKRFYPVNDKSKVSTVAKYLPIYPDYDYDQFSGRVGDGTQKDVFGVTLPQRGNSVGSLLEDFHTPSEGFGKLVYSNFVNSKAYGCIYGNYNLINEDPIVLATNSGKEWYIIENFASVEEYQLNQLTTLKVDLSTIISNAGGYTSGSLKLTRRKYNVPNDANKEPSHPFTIGESAIIDTITVTNNETIISFVDETPFIQDAQELTRFTNLAPIVFFENISASSEYNYICNSCDEDGNNNTGVIFRLQRIGTNSYKLWGNVGDPYEGRLVCRHIHSVSEYQSGFLVATGENYRTTYNGADMTFFEGGFIYLIKTTRNNAVMQYNYNRTNALTNYFRGTYRLTSSQYGVNRACGAYLMSDIDNTLLFMSDDLYGAGVTVPIEGRNDGFKRTTHGIYKISISDIDDLSKADCVAEIKEAGFGIVEHRGRLFACTSCGEAIFSTDFGKTWNYETISRSFANSSGIYYTDVRGIMNDGSVFYLNTEFRFVSE